MFIPSSDQQQNIIIDSVSSTDRLLDKLATRSLCHSSSSDRTPLIKDSLNNAVIIGASNLIGKSLTTEGTEFFQTVVPTEDVLTMSNDSLSWYRWEQLMHDGYNPLFTNLTDYRSVFNLLKHSSPSVIFYSPSVILSPITTNLANSLAQFLTLLEVIKDHYPAVPIVLISMHHRGMFELALSSYNRLYNIDMVIIRTKHVYGSLSLEQYGSFSQACFITDLSTFILNIVISQKTHCVVYDIEDCTVNNMTGKGGNRRYLEYLTLQTKNVVMTTYFTSQKNPQYKVEFMNNNYYFMENWFKSAYKLNLHMVVFHDELSEGFIRNITKGCPFIEFVKVYSFDGYTPNDKRYFLYYDYILSNKDVRYALMTDLRDIRLLNDPFEMMERIGDFVYLGIDTPFHETSATSKVRKALRNCFSFYPRSILGLYGNHNPGVIAGKRGTILSALSKYMAFIRMSTRKNCNTPAASYLFHTSFYDELFTGWPLQMGFMTNQPHPPGLTVLHKWDNESWS